MDKYGTNKAKQKIEAILNKLYKRDHLEVSSPIRVFRYIGQRGKIAYKVDFTVNKGLTGK